jgi:hypothetical protein
MAKGTPDPCEVGCLSLLNTHYRIYQQQTWRSMGNLWDLIKRLKYMFAFYLPNKLACHSSIVFSPFYCFFIFSKILGGAIQPKDKVVPFLEKWHEMNVFSCGEAFPGSRAFLQNTSGSKWSDLGVTLSGPCTAWDFAIRSNIGIWHQVLCGQCCRFVEGIIG